MHTIHEQKTPFHFTYINEKGEDVTIDLLYDKKNKKLYLVTKKVKQNIFKQIIQKIIEKI